MRQEASFAVGFATTLLFLAFGSRWLNDLSSPAWFAFIITWLFAATLFSTMAIVRHAEGLAEKMREPLGTLVLTLAVTCIEVAMISALMYRGHDNTALARDTMFAVVMIVLNGMVGLSLLLGGLRYHEQTYNLQGAQAYFAVIVPLSVFGLVLPNYTSTSPGPTFSPLQAGFLIVMSIGLYGVFLLIQSLRHRDYFVAPAGDGGDGGDGEKSHASGSVAYHVVFLAANLIVVIFLAETIAIPIDHGIHVSHAPPALGGVLVSLIVLLPESLTAVRAALANDLQRSINLLLGSVLASISLTIPAVLLIGFANHQSIVLGLDARDTVLLVLTLAVSTLTFASARTNVLLGAVHLLLFLAFVMLLFEN